MPLVFNLSCSSWSLPLLVGGLLFMTYHGSFHHIPASESRSCFLNVNNMLRSDSWLIWSFSVAVPDETVEALWLFPHITLHAYCYLRHLLRVISIFFQYSLEMAWRCSLGLSNAEKKPSVWNHSFNRWERRNFFSIHSLPTVFKLPSKFLKYLWLSVKSLVLANDFLMWRYDPLVSKQLSLSLLLFLCVTLLSILLVYVVVVGCVSPSIVCFSGPKIRTNQSFLY